MLTESQMLRPGGWSRLGGWVLRQWQIMWSGHHAQGSRIPGMPMAREDTWVSEATSPFLSGSLRGSSLCRLSLLCGFAWSRPLLPGHLCPLPTLGWFPQDTVAPSPLVLAYVWVSLYCSTSSTGATTQLQHCWAHGRCSRPA